MYDIKDNDSKEFPYKVVYKVTQTVCLCAKACEANKIKNALNSREQYFAELAEKLLNNAFLETWNKETDFMSESDKKSVWIKAYRLLTGIEFFEG